MIRRSDGECDRLWAGFEIDVRAFPPTCITLAVMARLDNGAQVPFEGSSGTGRNLTQTNRVKQDGSWISEITCAPPAAR